MTVVSPLDDRRQRAREAGQDEGAPWRADDSTSRALEAAIETATRVRVDDEIVRAAAATGRGFGFDMKDAIVAAFRAAGFEVEQ